MPKRALLAAFTALVAVLATIGVRFLTASAATSTSALVHPGVLVSRAQLDFVRGKVAAGAQPWKAAYDQMISSSYASLSRTPKPRTTVECGSYSNPNLGCTDEREDAIAAYTDALAWYLSGNAAYAKESIKLMDAWSATIKAHTNSNAQLQSADGSQPKYPPVGGINTLAKLISYWQGQKTFVDGLTQETCRDFVHTGYGLDAIAETAETTRIQGDDQWPTVAERMRQAMGFQTKFENGAAVPSNICGGKVTKGLGPVTEVAFNALHNRLGIAMTNTQQYTESRRPQGTDNLFVAWETLTHASNPA